MAAELKGKVLTVLGPMDPSDLGVTLTHEHLLLDFVKATELRTKDYVDKLADLDLQMKNLGKIQHYPYSVPANLVLDSEEEAISELNLFKQAGGVSLCDVTCTGIRTNIDALPRISRKTGVNIIAGTGYYVESFIPEDVKQMTVKASRAHAARARLPARNGLVNSQISLTHTPKVMADFMVGEVVKGVGGSGVRCGIIGEIGCSWPLGDTERRSLQAAALAQKETGAPLIIHPGRNESAPFEILDVLAAAGADLSRTVMSHLDRTILDDQKLLELAKRGCYLEYDLFGIECSHYQMSVITDMPSDAQRIQKVKLLIEAGYTDHILLAHDIHTKHRLVRYGGHGYAHILENIVPKMEDRGISRDIAMKILTENPRNWLTFV